MQTIARLLLCLTFGAILTCAGGCVAVAALLDKTTEPTDPAKYTPKRDYMVVMVESYRNPAMVEILGTHMERMIAEDLISHKVVPIINPDRLTLFKTEHHDEYRKITIPALGAQVEANQILYVDILEFTVESASGTDVHKGHAEARVKIVDVKTGKTRFPQESTSYGYQVIVDLPFASDSQNVGESAVRQALGRELAARISHLFYDATSKEPESAPSYPESDMR